MEHETISRAEAKANGLKFYFTGKPCSKGGIGLRNVSDGWCLCDTCKQERADQKRRHYKENIDSISEKNSQYRQRNREAEAERARRWREQNRGAYLERKRSNREQNREYIAAYQRRHYERNRESALDRARRYREENKDTIARYKRDHYEANPEKYLAQSARRRASKRRAVPAWFSELDQFAFEEAYDLAAIREAETGIEWHVDHMVPLQSKTACGLHCADNIQVIPADMNLSKGSKMVLTEPLEWLR
ncbi:hypothetical protein ST4_073 [Aeromonas phage ST4]|nr:hypothetical protein ST4_073 [Aeromonas phage ST4]